jgi:hypothetical protein
MTLGGSATACVVRLKDLSPHGAAAIGGPAAGQGARGSLTIEGAGAVLAFVVRQSEASAEGPVLHLEFDAAPQAAEAIGRLLPFTSAATRGRTAQSAA